MGKQATKAIIIRDNETIKTNPDLAARVKKLHPPAEAVMINAILRKGYEYRQARIFVRRAESYMKGIVGIAENESVEYRIYQTWRTLRSQNAIEYPTSAAKLGAAAAERIMKETEIYEHSKWKSANRIISLGKQLLSKDKKQRLAAAKELARIFNGPEYRALPKELADRASPVALANLARRFYDNSEDQAIRDIALEALKRFPAYLPEDFVAGVLVRDIRSKDPKKIKWALEKVTGEFMKRDNVALLLHIKLDYGKGNNTLRDWLRHRDPNMVKLAMRTLALAADRKAMPVMQGILHGEKSSNELKAAAQRAIREIVRRQAEAKKRKTS